MSRPFDVRAAMQEIMAEYGATDPLRACVVDLDHIVAAHVYRGTYGTIGVTILTRRAKIEFPFNFYSIGPALMNSCMSEAWPLEDKAADALCDRIVNEAWGDDDEKEPT